jgi:hypothetical protein
VDLAMSGAFLTLIEQAKRRDDVVIPYAEAIIEGSWTPDETHRMNQAIIDKWSRAGLRYVKDEAWKRISEAKVSREAS